MKWKVKPVVVEALPVSEVLAQVCNAFEGIPGWVRFAMTEGLLIVKSISIPQRHPTPDRLQIRTLDGSLLSTDKQWLVKGEHGELFFMDDAELKVRYEPG